jgi:hypothetical protein
VLANCLKALREGDVLVIWKLDRLGRDLKHLMSVVEDLDRRGVGFKVLNGSPIDTTGSQGKSCFAFLQSLAEFERDVIRERTLAGLASARARARKGGPPWGVHKGKAQDRHGCHGKPGHVHRGPLQRAGCEQSQRTRPGPSMRNDKLSLRISARHTAWAPGIETPRRVGSRRSGTGI